MFPILSFKTAIITGGAGGIGKAMAIYLLKRGKKVILVGRTESKLQATAKEVGATAYYVLDMSDISSITPFVSKVIKDYPDVDCLINNAGVQQPLQILGPDYDFDLSRADEEINTNIRGPMHLSIQLIQKHFIFLQQGAVIVNVSSILAFNPFSLVNPVYNGTKAWLHAFSVNLRSQLAKAESPIRVVEIVPPTVETDLHRERLNPNDNKRSHGAQSAMSVEDFMAEVGEGLEADNETISPGMAKAFVQTWEDTVGKRYRELIA